MPAKKKTKKPVSASAQLLKKCRQLPGELRQVCVDAALARYDRHYHPEQEHHRKHIIADAVLGAALLIAAALSLFFLFSYRQAGLHQQIDFVLTPENTTAISGDAMAVSVRAQNNTSQDLVDAYVTLPPVSGYILSRTSPSPDKEGRLVLGTLRPGQSHDVRLEGHIVGAINDSLRVSAILYYRTSALLNHEEKLASESIAVKESRLRLSLDMPQALVPDQAFDFALAYENTSAVTGFESARIVPQFPAGWETLESEPAPSAAGLVWDLGNIGSLESGLVRGRAVMRDEAADQAFVHFKLYASPSGEPLLQAEVERELPLYQPNVIVRLSGDAEPATLGDEVSQTLTIRNDESFPLRDVAAEFNVNLDLIDRAALPRTALVKDGRLTLPIAPELSAKSPLAYDLRWKIREQINPAVVFGNDEVVFRSAGSISYRDENNALVVIPFGPVETPLQSDARVQAIARYYGSSGEQIGRGPLPPVVAETTKYWVFLHVANQLHPLSAARVQASLPPGVDWTGRYTLTAGEGIRFDATARRIIWELGDVPDYKTDFTGEVISAGFEVAITPGQDDLGETMVLLNNIELQARDASTGVAINTLAPAVDTKLEQDAYATDDGRVRL